MLAQVLPGLRHVRAPLASGTLWLVLLWLMVGRSVPPKDKATGLLAEFYSAFELFGLPLLIGTAGTAAYLVGAIFLVVGRTLTFGQRSPRRHLLPGGFTAPPLQDLVRRFQEITSLIYANHNGSQRLKEVEPLFMADFMFPRALADDIAAAEFRWPSEAPDLYGEFDRRTSEIEFGNSIVVPLVGIAIAVWLIDDSWLHLAGLIFTLAIGSLWRTSRLRRDLAVFVLAAQKAGRVTLPALERTAKDAIEGAQYFCHIVSMKDEARDFIDRTALAVNEMFPKLQIDEVPVELPAAEKPPASRRRRRTTTDS